MDIFGEHYRIGLYLGVIYMHFRVFTLDQCTEWAIFFGVVKISIIFWGCLKFLIFFLGGTIDAGPEPTYEEK